MSISYSNKENNVLFAIVCHQMQELYTEYDIKCNVLINHFIASGWIWSFFFLLQFKVIFRFTINKKGTTLAKSVGTWMEFVVEWHSRDTSTVRSFCWMQTKLQDYSDALFAWIINYYGSKMQSIVDEIIRWGSDGLKCIFHGIQQCDSCLQ